MTCKDCIHYEICEDWYTDICLGSILEINKICEQFADHSKLIELPETNCPYCEKAESLVIGKTNDYGIAIKYPNILIAYGYDVHGSGSNGLSAKVNYCPMCGKKLKGAGK